MNPAVLAVWAVAGVLLAVIMARVGVLVARVATAGERQRDLERRHRREATDRDTP
ncbi:hypothetical protein [Curtobacterium sp. MCBD17_040]|uniref:hypothetical protein n=1 Tax=Curtobacterium sp. MCBD17_040 TaxID=2175674 RepID=UPI0015E8D080|nr:hypothetical protein [Curtobacterium sp. MCBD17_040]WIB65388.1 hypothetical protein DEI94_18445 [Curtobacterium sp. MCBD17_040]